MEGRNVAKSGHPTTTPRVATESPRTMSAGPKGIFPLRYVRSDRKPARTSSERSLGCSHAAK
jgi:hypothetical protein